jgi:hypothetical protein
VYLGIPYGVSVAGTLFSGYMRSLEAIPVMGATADHCNGYALWRRRSLRQVRTKWELPTILWDYIKRAHH